MYYSMAVNRETCEQVRENFKVAELSFLGRIMRVLWAGVEEVNKNISLYAIKEEGKHCSVVVYEKRGTVERCEETQTDERNDAGRSETARGGISSMESIQNTDGNLRTDIKTFAIRKALNDGAS